MTRTEMLELHDKIKENKFRENPVLNTKYAKGYYEQDGATGESFLGTGKRRSDRPK